MYVAVVVTDDRSLREEDRDLLRSQRPDGTWAAFIGEEKGAVIQQALKSARSWGYHKAYTVYVGVLNQEAVVPARYELRDISRK